MVKLQNISYSYGEKTVLKNINLTVSDGEKIGIVGESGCGKSTLIKLICGLYEVQKGTVSADGGFSVVMQSLNLFPLTIRENITAGHDMPEEEIWNAVRIAHLEEWINSLPEGLETSAGVRGNNFSGGQSQRISIARAVARNARNIILDEATSALDNDTSQKVMTALNEWCTANSKTLISIAHRAEALQYCDRIYRLENGELHEIKK